MKLSEYIKTGQEEGKEKHVPFISVKECKTCGELNVTVKVGETIFHPSTPEHHILYIDLYGITKENKLVSLTKFDLGKENTVPYVVTHVKKGVFKSVIAMSLCNIHGMWEGFTEC
ncbi:Neelaredoxin [bacterium]|nr:Neelaredoxin [bacterium]